MRKITEGHICSECLQFNRNKCQATGEVRAAINCACGRFELNEFAHAGETLVLMPEDDGEDVVLTPVEQPHQPADFDMENMQICSRCGQALPLEDFAVIPWSKDGKRFTICRHCRSEAIREAAARRRAAKKEREDSIQQSCVHWFRVQYPKMRPLLHHSANEGKRTMAGGRRVRAMGMVKGFPDLFLAVPRGKYHGLFIEMKSATGRVSPEQRDLLALLTAQGYRCEVVRCLLGFIDLVGRYMNLNEGEGLD